jgi:hypothetical protein
MNETKTLESTIAKPRVPVPVSEPSIDPKQSEHVTTTTKIKEKSPTKFGKANPVRDSILLVTLLGIMMLMTSDYGHPKEKTDEDDVKSSFDSMTAMLKELAFNATKKRRKDQCALFLHTGSIPNTGLSYFAGRNYTIGEVLLIDDQTFPVGNLFVTKSALVLKHHPILFNVQGILYNMNNDINLGHTMQFIVSKPITVGEEIFVEYNETLHSHSIYNHIPSLSDYNKTADIVIDALRSVSDQKERNGRTICSMGPVMRYVKRTVTRFNPLIATILPETQKRANRYRKLPPSIAPLYNQSIDNLKQSGICIDDLQPEVHDNDDDELHPITVTVKRHIRKGNIVTTIPLYIKETVSTGTCNIVVEQDCQTLVHNRCFTYESFSTFEICPLGPIMHLVHNNNKTPNTTENNIINAEYRWSTHRAISNFIMYDAVKYSTSVMAWDVIALRDISIGEKVSVPK